MNGARIQRKHRAKGKGKMLWIIGNRVFSVYQIVATFLDCLNSLPAVTKLAFSMIEVAAMILSAGSLLLSENKPMESHAISGVIPRKTYLLDSNFPRSAGHATETYGNENGVHSLFYSVAQFSTFNLPIRPNSLIL